MSEAPTPLLIFLKPPVPGTVKTRLAAELGDEPAARMYRAFLRDLLTRVATAPDFLPTLCVAGAPQHPALEEALQGLPPWPRRTQHGTTLGERMEEALAWALRGSPHALLIGSDVPTLPLSYLRQAVSLLRQGPQVVFGPCDDGGYCLVGAGDSHRPPLTDPSIRYSTAFTLRDTEHACARAAIATRRLPSAYDVDVLDDLRRLSRELASDSTLAPYSAALLQAAQF